MNTEAYIKDLVKGEVQKYESGDPIFVTAVARNIADKVNFNNEADLDDCVRTALDYFFAAGAGGEIPKLRKHDEEVFYLTEDTLFGEVSLNHMKLLYAKYVDGFNGYETGPNVLHKLGITSLMPRDNEFASNNVDKPIYYKEYQTVIRPGITKINEQNRLYLQTLDVLMMLDTVPHDCERPYPIILKRMKDVCLDIETLKQTAHDYYPAGKSLMKFLKKYG